MKIARKAIGTLAAVLLLAMTVLFPVQPDTALAVPPEGVPHKAKEVLPPGWERVSQFATQRRIENNRGGQSKRGDPATYEISISSLPATLPDNETVIDTQWYWQSDNSGRRWYQSGVNLFTARVYNGRVSVEDGNGHLSVWTSRVVLGGKSYSNGSPTVVDDPFNPNYTDNTLAWEYGSYATGSSTQATVTRYLRTIEGLIQELWFIPEQPDSGLRITIDRSVEDQFQGDVEWIVAWDSEGLAVPIWVTPEGTFVITEADLDGLTYPIWIDPTIDLSTSASDGFMYLIDDAYATARTSAAAETASTTSPYINVGQRYSVLFEDYYVARVALYFDTSGVPDDATISSAALYLAGSASSDQSDTEFWIQVQSGMPVYPHDPLVVNDFNYTYYTGNGGVLSTVGWLHSSYNTLVLNATGISWINLTGDTKFLLRSSREIAGTTPTGGEYVGIRSYEYGTGYEPLLRVVYSTPVVTPTVTAGETSNITETRATLLATVTDDGGESSSTRFQYDVSPAYGYATSWQPGYGTGDGFAVTIVGLSPGTLHYQRGQATNSAGTGTGSGATFLTLPYYPYSFVVTPGDTEVDLTWAKGAGSQKTMIRRATTGYPATPSDGTQVYFDTGTSETDGGLANGTPYFYSAWGYVTSGGLEQYSTTRITWSATPQAPALATVVTNVATSVGVAGANLNLSLTDLGGYGSVDISFEYGETEAYGDTTVPVTATSLGTLSTAIAGLDAATLYHFRARAENPTGWSYGADRTFTTGALGAPAMVTNAATVVQLASAQLNGTVTDDGGDPPVTVWLEWGLTTAYGTSTPSVGGLGDGSTFYYGLSGLDPDTEYHFRAVGENGQGISYGLDDTFTTDAPATPTTETLAATGIGSHQATLRGQVLTDGGVEVEVGFEYGLTGGYGTDTAWVGGYRSGQTFTALITGLDIDTEYHFRAVARNATGTGTGDDDTLTTVFTAPTNFAANAQSYNTINLSWEQQGDQTYIRYSTDGYPVDRADGTLAYLGVGGSMSLSGLSAGTTHYFKAWSWAEGDVWAATTATAVSTTFAATVVGADEPEAQDVAGELAEPTNWFTEPNQERLEGLPLYTEITVIADSYGIPYGTFFFLIGIVLVVVAGILGYLVSKSAVVAIILGVAATVACTAFGLLPGYMVFMYLALSGGISYLMARRGSI